MNQKIKRIEDYLKFKSGIDDNKEITIKNIRPYLIKYANSVKDLKKPTQKEIIHFISTLEKKSTKNLLKTWLRNFYRWDNNLDKKDKLPDFIKNIKTVKIEYDNIKYREKVITQNEYELLIKYSKEPIYKAIIELLYKTGVRKSELLSVKSNGVIYDGEFTTITVRDSKTIPREVEYNGRLEYLLEWSETLNPYKDEEETYLFYNNNPNKSYSINTINAHLKQITKKYKLRKFTVHDFRHTSISNDRGNGIPTTHIQTNTGLKKNSCMMEIYDHNKTKDYKKWMREQNKKTPKTHEKLGEENEELTNQRDNEIKILADTVKAMRKALKKHGIYVVESSKLPKEAQIIYPRENPKYRITSIEIKK